MLAVEHALTESAPPLSGGGSAALATVKGLAAAWPGGLEEAGHEGVPLHAAARALASGRGGCSWALLKLLASLQPAAALASDSRGHTPLHRLLLADMKVLLRGTRTRVVLFQVWHPELHCAASKLFKLMGTDCHSLGLFHKPPTPWVTACSQ